MKVGLAAEIHKAAAIMEANNSFVLFIAMIMNWLEGERYFFESETAASPVDQEGEDARWGNLGNRGTEVLALRCGERMFLAVVAPQEPMIAAVGCLGVRVEQLRGDIIADAVHDWRQLKFTPCELCH